MPRRTFSSPADTHSDATPALAFPSRERLTAAVHPHIMRLLMSDAQQGTHRRSTRAVLVATLIGFTAGVFGSFSGLGGGVVLVPLIVFVLRRRTHLATVTSLAVMQFLAATGVATWALRGWIDRESLLQAAIFAPAAMAGSSLIGVPGAARLKGRTLRQAFSVLLFGVALNMVLHGPAWRAPVGDPWPLWAALPCGLAVGTVSGLLGVGGGILAVPMLVLGFHFEQHHAHATSLLIILPTVVAGTVRAQFGRDGARPDWPLCLALAPGAVVGGILGPVLASHLSVPGLRDAFALLVSVIAARMSGLPEIVAGWRNRPAGGGTDQSTSSRP